MQNKMKTLLEADYPAMQKYIDLYGRLNDSTNIMDVFLQDYYPAKKKLFKLLGNKMMVSYPISIEKSKETIFNDMLELVGFEAMSRHGDDFYPEDASHPFVLEYYHFINNKIRGVEYYDLIQVINPKVLSEDTLSFTSGHKSICVHMPENKHDFRANTGMKPMRFLSKFVNWAGPQFFPHFEEFRLAHSRIFNDKILSGELVLSIHPLDFMTMSDNANHWQSCMNWRSTGCYRVGTQEMMNSDNVIVAYLKSSAENLTFSNYTWNSKKYRQLVYVTKPILTVGKSYPYTSKELSTVILSYVEELAKQNLKWTYDSDIEHYNDMLKYYIDEERILTSVYENKNCESNSIFFESNGMYNDMMKDFDFPYLCKRNKVETPKKICYSGKARCLDCGKVRVLKSMMDDNYVEDTNEDQFICNSCIQNHYTCSCCNNFCEKSKAVEKISYNTNKGRRLRDKRLCLGCASRVIKCPCCGEWVMDPILVWTPQSFESIIRASEDMTDKDFESAKATDFIGYTEFLNRFEFELFRFGIKKQWGQIGKFADDKVFTEKELKRANFGILCYNCKVNYTKEVQIKDPRRFWNSYYGFFLNDQLAADADFVEKISFKNVVPLL